MSNLILTMMTGKRGWVRAPGRIGRARLVLDRPARTMTWQWASSYRTCCVVQVLFPRRGAPFYTWMSSVLSIASALIRWEGSRDTEVAQPSTFRVVKEDGLMKLPVKWWLSCIFTRFLPPTMRSPSPSPPLVWMFSSFRNITFPCSGNPAPALVLTTNIAAYVCRKSNVLLSPQTEMRNNADHEA